MPALIPIDQVERSILAHLLQKHASWLQAAPRTTLDILEHLDIPCACPGDPDGSWVERINDALWDAGFTPRPDDNYNSVWYWREGISSLAFY